MHRISYKSQKIFQIEEEKETIISASFSPDCKKINILIIYVYL